jgi:hypothetical protein
VDASAANERSSASLEVMQIILAGGFAFDIVDRLSGGTLNIVVPDWIETMWVRPIISVPMAWWALNMGWLLFVSVCLMRLMAHLGAQALGALSVRVKVNRRVDIEKLNAFIRTRSVNVTDTIVDKEGTRRKMTWDEEDDDLWGGTSPTIEIYFDATHEFWLSVYFQIDTKKTMLREKGLMKVFVKLLGEAGALGEDFDLAKEMGLLDGDAEAAAEGDEKKQEEKVGDGAGKESKKSD